MTMVICMEERHPMIHNDGPSDIHESRHHGPVSLWQTLEGVLTRLFWDDFWSCCVSVRAWIGSDPLNWTEDLTPVWILVFLIRATRTSVLQGRISPPDLKPDPVWWTLQGVREPVMGCTDWSVKWLWLPHPLWSRLSLCRQSPGCLFSLQPILFLLLFFISSSSFLNLLLQVSGCWASWLKQRTSPTQCLWETRSGSSVKNSFLLWVMNMRSSNTNNHMK